MEICMTIGGTDPISGAGISQDLKVFSALGVYGLNVITAVTSQNLKRVYDVKFLDVETIENQIDAVMEEFKVKNVKIGLIGKREIGEILYKKILEYDLSVVFDPVMISTTNFKFVDIEDNKTLEIFKKIAKISKIVTPNKKEIEILTNISIKTPEDFKKSAEIIANNGNCVIKDEGKDYVYLNGKFFVLDSEKINIETHGSGCTFSSAITAYLTKNYDVKEAIIKAKEFTYNSIKNHLLRNDKSKNLKILNPFYDIESAIVKENINRALEILNKCKNKNEICPEVGINIAEIKPFSENIEDVGEFSGRIFYDLIKQKFFPVGSVEFNLKKHLSRALTAYIKFKNNTEIRAVINIKFSDKILKKFNKSEISYFEREEEKSKNEEDMTMEYGIKNALERNKNAKIIYDKGGIGKEPMIRVFGRDAVDVASKILDISLKF